MNLLQVIILAIVEGVTEFLPISSTGHLILTANLMKIPHTEFVKSFEVIIQLGAIMAVAATVIGNWNRDKIRNALIAFIPTGVLGLILYKVVKTYLLGNTMVTVAALLAGGAVILILEKYQMTNNKSTNQIQNLNKKQLLVIGLVQAVSMIPGVSRAMATIFGGMGVGLSRKEATEFSFLLAIPTMAAATGLDLVKSGWSFSTNEWGLLTAGFFGSMLTAWITVRWLISYVQKNDFRIFGWYRIGLAVVFMIYAIRFS